MSYKHNQTGRQKPPIILCGFVALETSSQKGAECGQPGGQSSVDHWDEGLQENM